jgi:hypothetical protein
MSGIVVVALLKVLLLVLHVYGDGGKHSSPASFQMWHVP